MIVLGVETSGPVGSLALRRDGRCVEERFLPGVGRGHAQILVPEARDLLRRHAVAPTDVDLVAVGVGPGSFTGLRVGVTFAKTFAYAADAGLSAVETFEAVAENSPAESAVVAIADAQRGGLAVGRYERNSAGGFVRVGELALVPQLTSEIVGDAVVSGLGIDRLPPSAANSLRLVPGRSRPPRASVVARLGERAAARGDLADAWTLEPLYVRKSGAEEMREAARQVSGG